MMTLRLASVIGHAAGFRAGDGNAVGGCRRQTPNDQLGIGTTLAGGVTWLEPSLMWVMSKL
jgi:hypothetical protein